MGGQSLQLALSSQLSYSNSMRQLVKPELRAKISLSAECQACLEYVSIFIMIQLCT